MRRQRTEFYGVLKRGCAQKSRLSPAQDYPNVAKRCNPTPTFAMLLSRRNDVPGVIFAYDPFRSLSEAISIKINGIEIEIRLIVAREISRLIPPRERGSAVALARNLALIIGRC